MLDLERIRNSIDSKSVAEGLGLQVKRIGKHYSILCPSHEDAHFGNCLLNSRGYACLACGAHGDIFQMAQEVLKCNFQDAGKAVAKIAGIDDAKDTNGKYVRCLSKEEQDLIGLHNNAVKGVYRIGKDIDPVDDNHTVIMDNFESGVMVELQTIDNNPLMSLRKTDKRAYNEVIVSLCQTAIEKRRCLISAVEHPSTLPTIERASDDNIRRWFYGMMMSELKKDVDAKDIISYLRGQIEQIREIADKHGGIPTKSWSVA